jgi:hypothetical protein
MPNVSLATVYNLIKTNSDILKDELDILEPLDKDSHDLLKNRTLATFPQNPLHIEWLLQEASTLLDTCLAYKNEAQRLELLVLTKALKELHDKEVINLKKEFRDNEHVKKHASNIAGIRKNAAADIKTIIENPDTNHDKFLTRKTEMEESVYTDEENFLKAAEDLQLKIQDEAWLLFERTLLKSDVKGSGLNYKERFAQTKALFDDTLIDTYGRLLAVEEGIQAIYKDLPENPHDQKEDKLPKAKENEPGYVNELVFWSRRMFTFLEQKRSRDTRFSYRISLKTGIKHNTVPENTEVFFEIDEGSDQEKSFTAYIKDGSFEFSIPEWLFEDLLNIRLRGVSVEYRDDTHINHQVDATKGPNPNSFSYEIIPPKQKRDGGEKIDLARTFGVARWALNTEPPFDFGSQLFNANPIGKWGFKILGYTPPDFDHSSIKDIIVTINCVARS